MQSKLLCIGLISIIGQGVSFQDHRALSQSSDGRQGEGRDGPTASPAPSSRIAVDEGDKWGDSNGGNNPWGGGGGEDAKVNSWGGNGGGSWGGNGGGGGGGGGHKSKPKPAPKPSPKKNGPKPKPPSKKHAPKPKPSGGNGGSWGGGDDTTWGGQWKNQTTTPTEAPIAVGELPAPSSAPSSIPTPAPMRVDVKSDDVEVCDCPNDFTPNICEACLTGNGFCADKTCSLECCEVKRCQCSAFDSGVCSDCLGNGNSNRCPDVDCAEACCQSYTYTAEGDSYKTKKDDKKEDKKEDKKDNNNDKSSDNNSGDDGKDKDKYNFGTNGNTYKNKMESGSENKQANNAWKYVLFSVLAGLAVAGVAFVAIRARRADPSAAKSDGQESALKRVLQRKKEGGKLDQEMEMGQTEYTRED